MRIVVLLGQALLTPVVAQSPPPLYIDKGACPFECCTYRHWTVRETTPLYNAVNGTKIVGMAKKGSRVQGVTGEVHTVPLKVKLKSGKEVYMLTRMGEGFWKTWDKGRVVESDDENLDKGTAPKSTWWVQIRLPNGVMGWSKSPENFGNVDACG